MPDQYCFYLLTLSDPQLNYTAHNKMIAITFNILLLKAGNSY